MANWFITTGISVLDSSRCWKGLEDSELEHWLRDADAQAQAELREEPSNWGMLHRLFEKRNQILAPPNRDPERLSAWAKKVIEEHFQAKCWTEGLVRALPAELATLNMAFRTESFQPAAGDHFTFIAGRSRPETAWLLSGALHRCRTADNRLQDVTIDNPMGPFALDPLDQVDFGEGMQSMWDQISQTLLGAVFVLTGGYKAILIDLAWRLARLAQQPPMLYSHEEGAALIEIQAVRDSAGEVRLQFTPHRA